ncbi:hypothetical protein LEP1GSC158_2294 [Leptospira interrogans serovar Zanoni str. LT2156]|uniref:Uncharacterized protein n=1 Tax=Leptospira interrogans serovar Zanoni str. LT2156 TaxID=1001601 RepID=M6HGH7_LEPIR|nr:hypothetical protein LEP1GSC158_2294 [Leptospira interrogans serovar Zanoni str. LT2156]
MIWKNSIHTFEPAIAKSGSRDIHGALCASSESMYFLKKKKHFAEIGFIVRVGKEKDSFV